jgi:hypothetical protein
VVGAGSSAVVSTHKRTSAVALTPITAPMGTAPTAALSARRCDGRRAI